MIRHKSEDGKRRDPGRCLERGSDEMRKRKIRKQKDKTGDRGEGGEGSISHGLENQSY